MNIIFKLWEPLKTIQDVMRYDLKAENIKICLDIIIINE